MRIALRNCSKPCGLGVALVNLVGLAAIFGWVGVACTNPTIEGGGEGTAGSGGGGGSGAGNAGGAGGTFGGLPTGPKATGGATGDVCSGPGATGCKTEIPEGCGDGVNNQGGIEQCDDGNVLPGDGCNGNCKTEPNWDCPADIRSGPCKKRVICGDGQVGPGEVCDDGNTIETDGCNATCTYQDPAFTCVPGEPCVRVSQCGNKRIEPGETCDDGNQDGNDGCSAKCQVEGGWVCPNPGKPCKAAPRCGDSVMQTSIGEVCDDGNQKDGDGCSADCKTKGVGCACTPGKLCQCPTMKCGNGVLEGSEKCDDGNTASNDGCSGDCKTVEKGYQCRVPGKACTPKCGDGVKSASEACDDGNNTSGDGCSATCKIEFGYTCAGEPSKCTSAPCGNGQKEGAEGCDDGNTHPFDGCSEECQLEPTCKSGEGCTSQCGDGIVLGEECDDGNGADGDGCSTQCKSEPGWTCKQPEIGENMLVPVIYRDFRFGKPTDFEAGVAGSYNPLTGIVKDALDAKGKPVYTGNVTNAHIASVDSFGQWYTDVSGVNHATATKMTLWNDGKGNYVNRYGADGAQWNTTLIANYCGTVADAMLDADGNPIPCTFKYQYDPDTNPTGGKTDCQKMEDLGYEQLPGSCFSDNGTYKAYYIVSKADGNPLFFPVDDDPFTPASERKAATIPPYYDASATWPKDKDATGKERLHNFSFTSEVRYWFPYDKNKSYTLDFVGDDDVWVFINGKLAVDLGGVHTPVDGQVVIGANGNGSTTVTATYPLSPPPTSSKQTANLGLQDGKVYEIAVFQAERQTDGSSYKLTLSGFNAAPSDCVPACGDGVTVGDEECDCGDGKVPVPSTCAGPNGNPAHNGCTAECKWGPFCGDGQVNDESEQCDNGSNNDDYGATNGCAPGCKLPARCGDKIIQADFDEECDDGDQNNSSSDPKVAYGGCMANCKRGGRCGDGITNGPEECDDGVNDSTYGTCNPDCTLGPRCGDGVVQSDYGEECEPTSSDDPDCTKLCRKPGGCGDGMIEPPEQCDDGALFNVGEYGGCAPSCIFAPHCGDGIMNGPEECDDGILDNSYGGCTKQCKLGPHCGDSIITPPEQCDNGPDNGTDGRCTKECKEIIVLPP
jgi:fibro-slime domain-containing protein